MSGDIDAKSLGLSVMVIVLSLALQVVIFAGQGRLAWVSVRFMLQVKRKDKLQMQWVMNFGSASHVLCFCVHLKRKIQTLACRLQSKHIDAVVFQSK